MLPTSLEVDSLETEQLLERHAVFAYVHHNNINTCKPPNHPSTHATMLKDRVFADGWPVAFLCSFECVWGGDRAVVMNVRTGTRWSEEA
jgi:hypothetical protein